MEQISLDSNFPEEFAHSQEAEQVEEEGLLRSPLNEFKQSA